MLSLPKVGILRGHKAFSNVLSRGKPVSSGSIKAFYAPSSPSAAPRVGFSVTRMIRKAAVRNRVKRCLREAYRIHKSTIGTETNNNLEVVFLYRGDKVESPSLVDCRAIEKDMIALLALLRKKIQQ